MERPVTYGGQALIEGVMIRGATCISIAVRRPNGEILVKTDPIRWRWAQPFRRVPFVRGVLVLAEMLVTGMRALIFSAQVSSEDQTGESVEFSSIAVGGTVLVSLALVIGIFFGLPVLLTRLVDPYLDSSLLSNLVEGIIRLGMFVGYIGVIGLMPDVRRVFAYHGAEHMTVHAHEHGNPLTVESVDRYETAHPRCGTAFILVVLVVAILVHTLMGTPPLVERILSRLLVLPIIAGMSYEIIRWSSFHTDNPLVKLIIAPNLALQSLTTRRPDHHQIEVAIQAMEGARQADKIVSSGD